MIHTNERKPGRIGRRLTALALSFALVCTAVPFAGAVSQSDIDALKDQQSQLKSQMSSVQSQIDDLQDQADSALSQALLYQQQIGILEEQIGDTQATIDDYTEQIAVTQAELEAAQAKADQYYQLFLERFRNMEETGSVSYWSILFDSSNFSDLLDRLNFVKDVVTYDNGVVDALEAARQEVADKEVQLQDEKAAQETALVELEDQQAQVQDASDKNDALLKEVQANQAAYQDQLDAMEADADEIAKDIVSSQEALAAQQAAAAAAAEAERKRQEAAASQPSNPGGGSTGGDSSSVVGSGTGAEIASYACQFLGNPYVWGGTSLTNGCDCSGFVMQVYKHFGYSLSHSSWSQANAGYAVSYSNAQAGDIIFYRSSGSASGGHVGIYIGGGKMVSALGAAYGICITNVNTGRSGFTVRRLAG